VPAFVSGLANISNRAGRTLVQADAADRRPASGRASATRFGAGRSVPRVHPIELLTFFGAATFAAWAGSRLCWGWLREGCSGDTVLAVLAVHWLRCWLLALAVLALAVGLAVQQLVPRVQCTVRLRDGHGRAVSLLGTTDSGHCNYCNDQVHSPPR
jgi:hypothetical protein